MLNQITISGQTGGTPPYTFYICDEYGNNCQNIGSTGGTITVSPFFQTANSVLIKTIDSVGCEFFTISNCS